MIRILVCAAASLLMVGVLYAEDKEKNVNPDKKPEAKSDVVKKESPEAVKKEGKEAIKKDAPESQKKQIREGVKKEGLKSEGDVHKGRVTVSGIQNGVITFSVDGHEYQFAVTENTRGMLKIMEQDGKDVVVSLQLVNYSDGIKKDGEKKELVKKEGQKNPGEKPADKPKEKKPE